MTLYAFILAMLFLALVAGVVFSRDDRPADRLVRILAAIRDWWSGPRPSAPA